MHLLVITLLATGALAQSDTDEKALIDIFGVPSTAAPDLDTFTVKPTENPVTLTNKDGQPCKCVPYYLCSHDLRGEHIYNASVTGWGELDIRFGEEDCQETVERCCTAVKEDNDNEVEPQPNPTLAGCGHRNRQGLDFTITGGTGKEAQFGEFPWVVAVLAPNGSQLGVGVLIHPQVVMTGAHIANKFTPENLIIRAGEWDTQTTQERLKHQEQTVQEIYLHKDFGPGNLFNDIALLRLAAPFQLDQHINVICMPSQDEAFDQSKGCVANGWGKNVFGKQGRYAVILKKLETDMVPHARCNDLLKRTRLGNNFRLHKSFVCAGGKEGQDMCTGDGGAPLVCPMDGDRYKLTGLVSWGIGCGGKDVPAVYTAVPAFRRWVDDKMAQWGLDTAGYNV